MKKLSVPKPQNWSLRELILFLERLELYISSGLQLNKALEISIQGVSKKHVQKIKHIQQEVENGNALSRALKDTIRVPSTILGLIAHGESSGELAKALNFSKQLLEREDELLKKCMSAMIYPVIIAIFALALTLGLMKGVMPQIIPTLKTLNVNLPLITRIIMFISDSLSGYGILFLIGPVILLVALILGYSRSKKICSVLQSLILHIPIIGRLFYLYFVSVFMHSLGSLVESGIPAASAYVDTVSAISFWPLKKICVKHIKAISRGVTLGSIMATFKDLPAFIPSLVSAGEMTGLLGVSLSRCALILDRDIEYSLKKLTSLVEPVMMVTMGAVVGTIALSIMIPIYDVSRVLQH